MNKEQRQKARDALARIEQRAKEAREALDSDDVPAFVNAFEDLSNTVEGVNGEVLFPYYEAQGHA